MYKILTLAIGICLFFTGCDTKPSKEVLGNTIKEIDYGNIENGIYTNNYFNMSVDIPENWAVQSQAAQNKLTELGGDVLAGENSNLKSSFRESAKQTVNLFVFFKHEVGAPVEFNPNIISIAENITLLPEVNRGSDYFFHVKQVLASGQVEYKFPSEIYSKEISSISFDVMPAKLILAPNIVISQELYATKINDYVLTFILSYSSDDELKELNQIIDSITFSD